MIKISIIMPTYNMAEFLERSINSVLQQSMKEIELICVDDASTDNSVEVMHNWRRKDNRLKFLCNTTRLSALQARKKGILAAQGEYIMFLDADDCLEQEACEILYDRMQREKVDILHFSAAIENEGVTENRLKNMETFVKPFMGELTDREVFLGCFREKRYRFSLWNKIYRADICKKAMENVPGEILFKANDLILYTAISLQAKSYKGIDVPALYHYSFGSGSTGSGSLSLEQFENYCYEAKAAKLFEQLVDKFDEEREYEDVVRGMKKHLLQDCIFNWKANLADEKAAVGFDLLIRYWGVVDTVSALAVSYHTNRAQLISKIYGAESLLVRKEKIKTIGIYYHRMGKGGVQRVISLLLPLYLELGYEVVLFSDEYEPDTEYPIPEQVKRVLLPSALTISYGEYGQRAQELLNACETYGVDMVLYEAAECRMLAYDMLLIKSMGLPFCVSIHGLFCAEFLNMNTLICEKLETFKLVDRLVVLSETEKNFWEIFGIPATYIPNPIQKIEGSQKAEEYILWLGRLESVTKQHMDAVNIMNKVVKVHPEAKMKIVGNEVTHDAKKNMVKRIAALKLEENIEVCEYTTDVEAYYERAGIFLVTSATESFSMTVVESKGYGIPLVTYEMPYLETLKEKKGYLSVPQNDLEAAAKAIITLLEDGTLRKQLGKEARESYETLSDYDVKAAWKILLEGMTETSEYTPAKEFEQEQMELVLRTMLQHYKKGSERIKGQLTTAKKIVVTKDAVTLQYIEPDASHGKLKKIYVKFYNLYVHYRKRGAKEAWRVIRNKFHFRIN